MENTLFNVSADEGDEISYKFIADGILLMVVVVVLLLDSLVIATLYADSDTVRSIRWIVANILLAGMVGAMGSLLRHTFQVGRFFAETSDSQNQDIARVYLLVINFGCTGRVLMATFYAVTVFIVVRCWNKPVLAPRNTKYFVIGAIILWILAILLTSPFIVFEVVAAFSNDTTDESMNNYYGIYASVPFIILSAIPVLLTLIFLVITVCFIKRNTITECTLTKKTLLKFGFFLIFGQGINVCGQIILPALFVGFLSNTDIPLIVLTLIAIFDLSLIPAPILIVIFFMPVRRKLRKWFCNLCCNCSVVNISSGPSQVTMEVAA